MLSLALAILLAAQDGTAVPVQMHGGGFCIGLGWMTVAGGKELTVTPGPDFRVFRYDSSNSDWWGIYAGQFSQSSGKPMTVFFERDGVTVHRVTRDGAFSAYLAIDKQGFQNEFFGAVFKGDASDKAFFDKVDFSPTGQTKCKENRIP